MIVSSTAQSQSESVTKSVCLVKNHHLALILLAPCSMLERSIPKSKNHDVRIYPNQEGSSSLSPQSTTDVVKGG